MKRSIHIVFLTFLSLLSGGCATLSNLDGLQDLNVTTENGLSMPVILVEDGESRIVTVPATIPMKSVNARPIFHNHPCYTPAFSKRPEEKFNFVSLLDLLFYPTFLIDGISGQINEYEDPTILPGGVPNPDCNETIGASLARNHSEADDIVPSILEVDPIFTPGETEAFQKMMGIMITAYSGLANVSSSIKDETGNRHVIASGKQEHHGYQIAFHNPTGQKTLYYTFVPRIMEHTITIADFRETIPTVSVEGKQTLPYIVTDFNTGEEVDPLDPNRYTIRLDSGGVDLMGGSSFSFYGDWGERFILNLGISAGITLAEYQRVDLELGRDRVKEERFRIFNAYQGGINGYLIFPDMDNVFAAFGYTYMHYPSIGLPKKVEFKNTMRYNEDKQIFERERVFVDDVELEISTFSLSIGVLF